MSRRPRTSLVVACAIGVAGALAPEARAQRPTFEGGAEPASHDGAEGLVRVHYAATAGDAVPPDDADEDGVPDFVEEVAELAEVAWQDLLERGFRPPVSDGAQPSDDNGGDGRFDIYLADFAQADGNFVAEACTDTPPVHCSGYFLMDNDLAEFDYASITEGISVLTSHELFHAVQAAYSIGASQAWSEGTAVWNEEKTFPEQGDYERFTPYFLARSSRPFERGGSGFGDPYVYGAAVWPTFLDERYGDGVVRRTWEAMEAAGPGADFLDAIDEVVAEEGASVTSAWVEFTRWNLLTGPRADAARSYAAGADLGEVAFEDAVFGPGEAETSIIGLSARYLPVSAASEQPLAISVEVDEGGAAAAFFPQASSGGPIGEPVELVGDGVLSASLPSEAGFLVVTGTRRGGLPRAARVAIAVDDDPPDDGGPAEDEGGCQAARSGSGRVPGTVAPLLAALVLLVRGPRRRGPRARGGA